MCHSEFPQQPVYLYNGIKEMVLPVVRNDPYRPHPLPGAPRTHSHRVGWGCDPVWRTPKEGPQLRGHLLGVDLTVGGPLSLSSDPGTCPFCCRVSGIARLSLSQARWLSGEPCPC